MVDEAERGRHRTRDAVLAGGSGAPAPRTAIAASWRRVAASGVDPGGAPAIAPLSEADLERRRTTSGLAGRMPALAASLSSAVDAGQLVVVTDTEGRVLWQDG